MGWSEGYVSDINYPAAFFREQSPGHLNFSCILNGYEPIAIDRPFTYMELGSGQGLTANILAASNPQGKFYAVDFNPSHVSISQQLSEYAELDNLEILEASFSDLAAGKFTLPQFDFVTMYGVYSWVDGNNQKHIVNFLKRYLKPGGIVYINYNAMPGWCAALPLQRLLLEMSKNILMTTDKLQLGRKMVEALKKVGAKSMQDNPNLQYRINSLYKDKEGYLAHEYMDHGWRPLYHADVVRDVAAAKLNYVASAELSRAFPELFLSDAQRDILQKIPKQEVRETVLDYMTNTSFREDIFIRGARKMNVARQNEWLGYCGVALTTVPLMISLDFKLPIGMLKADERSYMPLLDALVKRPHALVELVKLPGLSDKNLLDIAKMAALLTSSGQASTYFTFHSNLPDAPSLRMNRALAELSQYSDNYRALASPLLGNGVRSGLIQRLLYKLLPAGVSANEMKIEFLTTQLSDILCSQGAKLEKDGRVLEGSKVEEELAYLTETIVRQRFPVWQQLHML